MPVIRSGEDAKPALALLQWWLLPWFSEEPKSKYTSFNARMETVAKAPAFRGPFKHRRCLVPVLGYYEWQVSRRGKLPWLIQASDGQLMHLAGLWDRWKKEDQTIESFTIIVGPANAATKHIHDRNPVMIPPERQHTWLDRDLDDPDKIMELLQPIPDEALTFHRVSRKVNNTRNEGEELIRPVQDPIAP